MEQIIIMLTAQTMLTHATGILGTLGPKFWHDYRVLLASMPADAPQRDESLHVLATLAAFLDAYHKLEAGAQREGFLQLIKGEQ